VSHRTEVVTIFVRFLPIFVQNLVAIATSLRSLQWEMSCLDWPTMKIPHVISNQIFDISHRNAFIAILVPKLFAMVTLLCSLCIRVSQINLLTAKTISQNQTIHGYVACDWCYDTWTEGATYIQQGGHHVGHWPTFLVYMYFILWLTHRPHRSTDFDVLPQSCMQLACNWCHFWDFCLFWPKFRCHGNVS